MSFYVPKPCCISGSEHKGEPKGKVTTIHNLPCYIAEPASSPPKAIIVYIPDVFGWDISNARILADGYAARTGARVYLPDFMAGYAFPASLMKYLHVLMEPQPNIFATIYHKAWPVMVAFWSLVWRVPYISDKYCRPRVLSFMKGIRENEAKQLGVKVGVAGFCWGGHYAIDLCSGGNGLDDVLTDDGSPLVDAGFTAHPGQFDVPGHIQRLTIPLAISIGDVDLIVPLDKCKEIQRVMETKQGELDAKGDGTQKGKFEIDIIPGAVHGYATRGHLEEKVPAQQAKRAEDQAVTFFARWIGSNA